MKLQELRNLSKEDLSLKLVNCKEELAKLSYLKNSGQIDKPHQFKILRKTVARINTLLKEAALAKKE
ncbi:MAG: 50S ribosomal protein L29 [Candidatus Omnitrophica bacterium CG1_02_44_16]|nr:MAG: 50S ribosomal protein L29 [Candidatus Omnitrophica bacterium CG1_02_44_16]PIY82818.1 MAG: 50S ribosomal protein L29 [Candidatus Omnitrophica bacterium CG_4_10_14_0_8_um_filter_44_12]PIZ84716.1 MAG: 50S ribosomal protein L29 [Candidatus Omnitrophica bacterium CG_4_10_14_0_2_um_filter_44_9]